MVSSLSPMKTNQSGNSKYFSGNIMDGKSDMRLVGFDAKQQRTLEELRTKEEPVALVNCEVKPSRWGNQLEVVIGRNTIVKSSPNKFDVMFCSSSSNNEVMLNEVKRIQNFQKVTARVKVVNVKKCTEVNGGLMKQDVIVGDASGISRVTVWEENVGILKEGVCYKLSGMTVRIFNKKKYLSMSKEGCEIEEIDDIGDVETVESDADEDRYKLKNAVIIGVSSVESYRACMFCKAKVETSSSKNIAKCSKCYVSQRYDRCTEEMNAKLMVEDDQNRRLMLCAFSAVLKMIAGPRSEIDDDTLLMADPFDLIFNERDVITSISCVDH